MNPRLEQLQPYPFERLRQLLQGQHHRGGLEPIALSIGEPQHAAPGFVREALAAELDGLSRYPSTRGLAELRQAIADWLCRRFGLEAVDSETEVLPVNGTREALFAFAQAVIDPGPGALVLSPNPGYQIYEGAALLAGATPLFLDCSAATGLLPDFSAVSEAQWRACQLLYLCSPGNPTGAVMSLAQLQQLVQLAREHDFIIASDECYSEIYREGSEPPPGLLQACAALGDDNTYRNCVVFHSLSKRSNLPGLRSGFVAGDAAVLERFLLYRTYHGCAMPPHHQRASIAAWADERHVEANRRLYDAKFSALQRILAPQQAIEIPRAGFYLWLPTPASDTEFARDLYRQQHLTVLPGSFLAREAGGRNPGASHVRLALVAQQEECETAARRLVDFIATQGCD